MQVNEEVQVTYFIPFQLMIIPEEQGRKTLWTDARGPEAHQYQE